MKIAVEGCCHGELNRIYAHIESLPADRRPELLVIGGDFQAVRNGNDLRCIAMPAKYRRMGDFQDYYTGRRRAPVLTVFVGGNHEASNHLQELKFGGWVAPDIYYVGKAGVVWYKGVKIGGMLGIYNAHNFAKPSYEVPPYNASSIRSAYHVRKLEYVKFLLYGKLGQGGHGVDVFVSHDWPQGIEHHGDLRRLLDLKPFFKGDVESGRLGSPVNRNILRALGPRYWYSAHLHVKFEAEYVREENTKKEKKKENKNENEITVEVSDSSDEEGEIASRVSYKKNQDEIDVEISDSDNSEIEAKRSNGFEIKSQRTRFLALDKCLPRRQFLSIEHVTPQKMPESTSSELFYDELFLKINKFCNTLPTLRSYQDLSTDTLLNYPNEELDLVLSSYRDQVLQQEAPQGADLAVPRNFQREVDEHDNRYLDIVPRVSSQTEEYCLKFGIDFHQDER